ncbi:MAG: PAS domain-containing protein [candidate division NC10 bacterium]|nr:PAS domain-containing protein [candidate division NC10 bacterium]MCZ6551417.1 ATP-binding protein [candidate division NC10 bacterium]
MRFGIKGKEVVAITLLTLLVVATTTFIHLSQLTRVVVQEALQQAELIAKQMYARSSRSLSRARGQNPAEILRRDQELRTLLDASVGYSPHLLYALIADQKGKMILNSEREKEGSDAPERPSLEHLLSLDPIGRFRALYERGKIYETTLPLSLNNKPFGSIRLGITTSLLRRELNASLQESLALAGLTLPVAWLVAMGLGTLILKPIRRLTREVDRIGRGDFEIDARRGRGDEIGELTSQLQLLGQQLQADRLKMLGEKAQLQQVVDHLEDAIILFTRDRRILFFNKAAEVVVRRPLEHVVGWPWEDMLEPSHPLQPLLEQAFEQQVGFRNATIALPRDGGHKEFLVSVFFVTDAQQAMGAMVVIKDLESIKTLQSLISYSAKLTALGRLTSGVAHEVKNPLNAMMIHLEIVKEKLDVPPEQVKQSLEVIGSEIRRLDRVVQGFLKFIRPEELSLKLLDVNALLKDVVALLETEWQKDGIRFAFQFDPILPLMAADEELLRQAFLNILLNACQAMPTGGTVAISTEQEGGEIVRVSIADTGVGIPPEDIDKIFHLYYTTKPGGSGIGLSLVYRVAQMHDGSIEVSSKVGRGTTMVVRLPVG